jgi:hypothetical protein
MSDTHTPTNRTIKVDPHHLIEVDQHHLMKVDPNQSTELDQYQSTKVVADMAAGLQTDSQSLSNSLWRKSDLALEQDLRLLIGREREILSDILSHLREVQRRRLYLQRAYSSMFDYCVRGLGYSEHAAQARISAMRLTESVAGSEEMIKAGRLSLSVASKAHWAFRRADKAGLKINKREVIAALGGVSARQADQLLATALPELPQPERIKPVSETEVRIEFTAHTQLLQKLDKLKSLTAHRLKFGSWAELIDLLADIGLEKLDPVAKAPVSKPTTKAKTRALAPNVRRYVWKRAGACCEYTAADSGQRCGSAYALQIDHIHEFARGGDNQVDNLRLLCAAHNRHRASLE